jgi:membrane protein required for colicin V production
VLAFIVIFAGTWIGGKILVSRIAKSVRRSFAGSADRLLGALFGGLKGLIYVTLFYMAVSFVYDTIWGRDARRPDWIRNAVTYPLVHGTADTFVDLVDRRRQGVNSEPATIRRRRRANDADPALRHARRGQAAVRAGGPLTHHHVCVRSHRL